MKIINLIENTEGHPGCICKHGLSFYIETKGHVLLCDLGPSEKTLENARTLGLDLKKADTVILSHGHYDHSGGIMAFAELNPDALIYMQEEAPGMHYAYDGDKPEGERYRYNGIDRRIPELPQVRFLRGDFDIDEEIGLITVKERKYALPFTSDRLLVREDGRYRQDQFTHEQSLVLTEEGVRVLVSGCAHNGILNIMEAFREKYGSDPETVISGFHLMKKTDYLPEETDEIRRVAEELMKYDSRFITCHCTGTEAYRVMKAVMGDRLSYVHSGEEVPV